MGPNALMPMLEAVAFDAHAPMPSTETALARIGSDGSVALHVRVQASAQKSEPGGTRERAILGGMHDGRRAAIAKVLAARVA